MKQKCSDGNVRSVMQSKTLLCPDRELWWERYAEFQLEGLLWKTGVRCSAV